MEKIWPKAPWDYSASFWIRNLSICLWERQKTTHFHDLEMFRRVHDSHNQLSSSFETPGRRKKSKKDHGFSFFRKYSFYKSQMFGSRFSIPDDPLIIFENLEYEINILES